MTGKEYAIGNLSIDNYAEGDCPIVIVYDKGVERGHDYENGYIQTISSLEHDSITFTITKTNNIYHKISKEYLPTELPDVNTEDNGSVLTVVNGEWDKVEPESNYYAFGFDIVQDGTSITATPREGTTFQAIIAAMQKTHNVYMDAFYQDGTVVHNLVQSIDKDFIGVNFLVYDGISKVFSAVRFSLHSDNTSVITVVPLQAMSI